MEVVFGGIITILVAIWIEWLRTPKLDLRIESNILDIPPAGGQTARRHLRVVLRNKALPRALQWIQRSAALQCQGQVAFHSDDNHKLNLFGNAMRIRWANSPEPMGITGQIIDLHNPAQVISRIISMGAAIPTIDVYPGEEEILDIAVRFDGEDDFYGWNNESYFNNWRTPAWEMPKGKYLVKVEISSSGSKCTNTFRLFNQMNVLTSFRLEDVPEDQKI